MQTRSNQCPSDIKNFMNSISRPHSALNRLGSFISFKLSQQASSEGNEPLQNLADQGLIYKQSSQLCHSMAGNSKTQISAINQDSLQDRESQLKYFGTDNRMLNGLMTQNVELAKSLNYQVPEVSGQDRKSVV